MSPQPPPDPYPGSQPPTGWEHHPSPYSHPYPYGTPYGSPYGGQYPNTQPGYLPPIYPQPPPQLTVGEVLRRAWAAFVSRIKEYLIVALGFGLVLGTLGVVVLVGFFGVIGTSDSETGAPKAVPTALLVAVIILFSLVAVVGGVMLRIFETRIALAAVDGEVQLGLGDLLRQGLRRFWPFVGWTLLSALLQFAVVCIPFGSVVVQFFLLFVPLIVLDHPRMAGANPLKASYESVKAQAGEPDPRLPGRAGDRDPSDVRRPSPDVLRACRRVPDSRSGRHALQRVRANGLRGGLSGFSTRRGNRSRPSARRDGRPVRAVPVSLSASAG